jgi:hypothetical protein
MCSLCLLCFVKKISQGLEFEPVQTISDRRSKIRTSSNPKFTPNLANLSTKSIKFNRKHSDFKIRTGSNLPNFIKIQRICQRSVPTKLGHKSKQSKAIKSCLPPRVSRSTKEQGTRSIDHPFNTKEKKTSRGISLADQIEPIPAFRPPLSRSFRP